MADEIKWHGRGENTRNTKQKDRTIHQGSGVLAQVSAKSWQSFGQGPVGEDLGKGNALVSSCGRCGVRCTLLGFQAFRELIEFSKGETDGTFFPSMGLPHLPMRGGLRRERWCELCVFVAPLLSMATLPMRMFADPLMAL